MAIRGPENIFSRPLAMALRCAILRVLGNSARNAKGDLEMAKAAKKNLYGLEFAQVAQAQAERAAGRRVHGPADVHEVMAPIFVGTKQEQFWVMLLDTKHQIIGLHLATQGLVDRSQIHAREVFRWAVSEMASAVMLIHNHPSGDTTPSPQDLECTKTLVAAGKIIGINVLDHLVVGSTNNNTDRGYMSFREAGLL